MTSRHSWTKGRWLAFALLAVVLIALVGTLFIDDFLRRYVEAKVNDALDGYTLTIGKLDVHPLGLALDLHHVTLFQDDHTDQPILNVPRWSASLHWTKIWTGHIVSDHHFDQPSVYVTRPQAGKELKDKERGWQDAVLAVYPVAINRLMITDGSITYVDSPNSSPLELRHVKLTAHNIRNVESGEREYPSTLELDADVFEKGHLHLDGRADFLAKPQVGIDLTLDLRDAPLRDLLPLAGRYHLHPSAGTLTAQGRVEYSPWARHITLSDLTLQGLRLDYVHTAQARNRETRVAQKVEQAQQRSKDQLPLKVDISRARVTGSELGFVNDDASPAYRVFVSHLEIELHDFSTTDGADKANLTIQGNFMGTGRLAVNGAFQPAQRAPDFTLHVKIIKTKLKSMNNLFRAYGDFDVKSGTFAFFSEVTVKNGRMDGYLKPFFKDIDVYDPSQDKEKGFFRQVYEGLIGSLTSAFENAQRDEVATLTDVSGPLSNPDTSMWQILVNLVKNAFFEAILPEFKRQTALP